MTRLNTIYNVKEGIYYKRRDDLEIRGIQCICIEVASHNKGILFALFYRPSNSNASFLSDIKCSIALAIDKGILEISNLVYSDEAKKLRQ